MSLIKELSRFAGFLKRLFSKLPGAAEEAKDDLDRAIRALAVARQFVPKQYQDELDKALEAAKKLRAAADLVEDIK